MKKLLLTSFTVMAMHLGANAQAYDGLEDSKLFLGYVNVGGKSGVEFQFDRGISDLVSYGARFTFLIKPDDRENQDNMDSQFKAFDSMDAALFFRFHFSEPLKLSERIDPFLSLDLGLKSIGSNVGIKYNFSETLGLYAMYNYSFSSSFIGDHKVSGESYDVFEDNVNFFGKKSSVMAGLTINLN